MVGAAPAGLPPTGPPNPPLAQVNYLPTKLYGAQDVLLEKAHACVDPRACGRSCICMVSDAGGLVGHPVRAVCADHPACWVACLPACSQRAQEGGESSDGGLPQLRLPGGLPAVGTPPHHPDRRWERVRLWGWRVALLPKTPLRHAPAPHPPSSLALASTRTPPPLLFPAMQRSCRSAAACL